VKLADFIFPFMAASAIHGMVFSWDISDSRAAAVIENREQAVMLNIVSAAGRGDAHTPSEADRDDGSNDDLPIKPADDLMDIDSTKNQTRDNSQNRPEDLAGETKAMTASVYVGKTQPQPLCDPLNVSQTFHLIVEKPVQPEPLSVPAEFNKDEAGFDRYLPSGVRSPNHPRYAGLLGVDGENSVAGGIQNKISGPARVRGRLKPEYPRYSRIRGEEGRVVLSVQILADGSSGVIEIVRSSGHRRLDEAAVRAVENAVFVPASIDGEAVESTRRFAFRFDLDDWEE
jgi:protein TonB